MRTQVPQKCLLLSVRPQFAEQILLGIKSVELRRTRPSVSPGDWVLLYASAPVKALVGAFEVKGMQAGTPSALWPRVRGEVAVDRRSYDAYYEGANVAYAIHVSQVVRFDSPVRLSEIQAHVPGFHPPQSYFYLHGDSQTTLCLLALAGQSVWPKA